MVHLEENWLTEGTLDFEYKKYLLLAYCQHVQGRFSSYRLFPELREVRRHYENCKLLSEQKQAIRDRFPKDPVGVDMEKMQFRYRERFENSPVLSEVENILRYSLPVFSQMMETGRDCSQQVESDLLFTPIGILPLRNDEGYLFIYRTTTKETAIYQYRVALYDDEQERVVHTTLVDIMHKNTGTTFENIKVALTKKYKQLPNPAAYMVESEKDYPVSETLLPLAKKMMLRHLHFA